jgi:TP901 family phage tail tape measure protein
MAELARLYIRVDADGKPYVAGLQDIERRTDDFARRTESSLGKWSKRAGVAIAAGLGAATVALGALTTKAVQMTMTYDQALTNAISATGKYGEAAQEAKKQADALAQELGRKTAFSAKEAADAMYDLASKGYDVSDWAKTLPGIINLASATQSDLASTTELVTSTINQFGMAQEDSTRVADVYTKAIAATGATQEKLALSMRYVGPIAASMGWSLEQTTAVLGRLYDAGYLGEQAGTALRGAISALIDPSAEAANTLASLNVSADLLSTDGIEGVVRAMTESNATTADFAKVFGTEAAPAMLALRKYAVEGEESVDKLEEALKDAGGTAELVANEQLNTAAGQIGRASCRERVCQYV